MGGTNENQNKEELNFYERILFEQEKLTCRNTNQLRYKYQQMVGYINFEKVYRSIVNWRISKYGTSCIVQFNRHRTHNECMYLNELARQRKKSRLGR